MNAQEEARERLLSVIPYFRYAFQVARAKAGADGSVEFAVFSKAKDSNEGHLACHFDPKDFIEDLAIALGEDPSTIESGLIDAQAEAIVQMFTPQEDNGSSASLEDDGLPEDPAAKA